MSVYAQITNGKESRKICLDEAVHQIWRFTAFGEIFEGKLEDWHSEECKLMPTLTFDLLTWKKIGDQDLLCIIQWRRLDICKVVFVVVFTHIHTHAHTHTHIVQSGLMPYSNNYVVVRNKNDTLLSNDKTTLESCKKSLKKTFNNSLKLFTEVL